MHKNDKYLRAPQKASESKKNISSMDWSKLLETQHGNSQLIGLESCNRSHKV